MIGLYRFLMTVGYYLLYPYGIRECKSGKEIWKGRMGSIETIGRVDVWLHCSSAGEAKVISYLVDYLLKQDNSLRLHVTVMTEAGYKTASSALPSDVSLSFFPLDSPIAIRKTFDRIIPRVIVVAETELWPNLILEAAAQKIPIVQVNGRMSERAFGRYKLISRTLSGLLSKYDRLFLRTDSDLRRYSHFGVDSDRAVVLGDMKFDAPLPDRSAGRRLELRRRCGVAEDEFLFLAGSTRPDEESQLIDQCKQVKKKHPKARLLLAPRHIDRCGEIEALIKLKGLQYQQYGESPVKDALILLSTIGQLTELYLAADLAFVGGTLADFGGHNLVEPVWAGVPVLFGPSTANIADAAEYIEKNNFGVGVKSATELREVWSEVIEGTRRFKTKEAGNLELAATAGAGKYILGRLKNV